MRNAWLADERVEKSALIRSLSCLFISLKPHNVKGKEPMSIDTKENSFTAAIKELLAKRALIDATLANLVALSGGQMPSVDLPAGLGFAPQGNGDSQPFELPRGAFLNKSLPEAIKLYLSAVKKKQTIREIATALKDGGVETNSDNFENVITGCLNRMKSNGLILRFKEGWALAEFYPAHLRTSLSQDKSKKPKTAKKKAKKISNTVKLQKQNPASSPIPADGLESRIEAYALEHTGEVVNFKQVAKALPGTVPSVVSLALGRMAKKRGWNKTTDGGYHIVGKVQEMAKAV
jgi:hypothetical protein